MMTPDDKPQPEATTVPVVATIQVQLSVTLADGTVKHLQLIGKQESDHDDQCYGRD